MLHSKSIFILLTVVACVALYLGVMLPQMGVVGLKEVLVMVFGGASAVLMLYFAVLATMLINRDYGSNCYRILVGMGVSRRKIFISKYVLFLVVGLITVMIHGLVSSAASSFKCVNDLQKSDFKELLLYFVVYVSIISVVFLLATIGRTVIKSIVINIAFIIMMSILPMSPSINIQIFPIQFLQIIAEGQNTQFIEIVIISLIYTILSGIVSYVVFVKQEL